MKRLHQILLTITLYGILLTGCERAEKNQAASEADENRVTISDSSLQLMDVKIGEVESKIIQSYVYLNGKVVSLPNYRASVSSDIEGKVDQFFVKEGSYVKKGEPLIALRSMALVQLQSDYVEAKSQNDFLAIEFSRQEELMKNKVGALADFQVTEAKYKAARSKLSALAAKLRLLGVDPAAIESPNRAEMSSTLIIRAPIDGFVYKIFVVVGTLATTDIILAELVNTEEMMADVFVYDNDLDEVSEGEEVHIDFINHLYPSVHGKIIHMSRAFDPETRSVTAHVGFRAPEGKLILPDMTVRCVLPRKVSQVPGPTVPRGAILTEEDHDFVFVTYPSEKKGGDNVFYKERILIPAQNEEEAQIRFANEIRPGFRVVVSNVLIVENQRKKLNGMITE